MLTNLDDDDPPDEGASRLHADGVGVRIIQLMLGHARCVGGSPASASPKSCRVPSARRCPTRSDPAPGLRSARNRRHWLSTNRPKPCVSKIAFSRA